MTWTQLFSIGACGALGYWLVAVFLPLIVKSKEDYREAPETEDEAQNSDDVNRKDSSVDAKQRTWFEVLEVREDSSASEITSAYRQKIRQYHPDRVAQMGPDIRQLAERRSIEINSAYENAMRLRGR